MRVAAVLDSIGRAFAASLSIGGVIALLGEITDAYDELRLARLIHLRDEVSATMADELSPSGICLRRAAHLLRSCDELFGGARGLISHQPLALGRRVHGVDEGER